MRQAHHHEFVLAAHRNNRLWRINQGRFNRGNASSFEIVGADRGHGASAFHLVKHAATSTANGTINHTSYGPIKQLVGMEECDFGHKSRGVKSSSLGCPFPGGAIQPGLATEGLRLGLIIAVPGHGLFLLGGNQGQKGHFARDVGFLGFPGVG